MGEVCLVLLIHSDEPLKNFFILQIALIIENVRRVQCIAILVEVVDLDTAEKLQVSFGLVFVKLIL